MYRFCEVDVSDTDYFSVCRPLKFKNTQTVIAADNGIGKTIVVSTLREIFEKKELSDPSQNLIDVAPWIVFYDPDLNLVGAGVPWEPLTSLASHWEMLSKRRKCLERLVEKNVRLLLRNKIETDCVNKFSSLNSVDQVRLTLDDRYAVFVSDDKGRDISHLLHALEECAILYFAINAAVREVMNLDYPLVVDCPFFHLDFSQMRPAYELISSLNCQKIIIEFKWNLDALGLKPDFLIKYNFGTQKWMIWETPVTI